MKLRPSAVAELAARLGLPLEKPVSLKTPEILGIISSAKPEAMIVAAYGLILPKSVLAIPPRGCLNIHASLLPRWRGAAPVQRALLAGDAETGVTIMVMEVGLDTGPVLMERRVPIGAADTARSLTEKLSQVGAEAIVETLGRLDTLVARTQAIEGVTYAAKIEKSEASLDWTRDAAVLDRQVRAFDPFPGAETTLDGEPLKVWQACPVAVRGEPGVIVDLREGCPVVACGVDGLVLTVVQRPGSRRMPASDFVKGRPMLPGTRLGSASSGNA